MEANKSLVSSLFESSETQPIKEQPIEHLSYLRDESKLLDLKLLIPNEKNRKLDDANVLDLARNIRINGLLQYPIVVPNDDGTFTIIAGHNRIAACNVNVKTYGEKQFERIRCIIKPKDDINNELMMIDTNLKINALGPYDMMIAIGRKEELLKKMKSENKLKGNLKDIIAEQSTLARSQVQTYLTIYKKGSQEVKNELKQKKINLSQALNLSKLPKEDQVISLHKVHDKKKNPDLLEKSYIKLLNTFFSAAIDLNDYLYMLPVNMLDEKQKDMKELTHRIKTLKYAVEDVKNGI